MATSFYDKGYADGHATARDGSLTGEEACVDNDDGTPNEDAVTDIVCNLGDEGNDWTHAEQVAWAEGFVVGWRHGARTVK